MADQNLFNKGFPTNRIPITLPSTGQSIVIRETTITELKSICKTIIDNLDRKQMHVIYDAMTDYLQAMILTDGVDVNKFTEFDRLFCLMVFFQMSFFKDPITHKCPHCGVDIVYRYDMSKYLDKLEEAYVDEQTVDITYKTRKYSFTIGWPTVSEMSNLMRYFYNELGEVTDEMEQTQYGINFVLSFIKSVTVYNIITETVEASINISDVQDCGEKLEAINVMPSMVIFDNDTGIFSSITGYFINRMENCFSSEICPQCHKETDYGLSQSSYFYGLFYGSLKSLYGYIMQVECLMVFRYDCFIFDKEQYMTYNDFNSLVHQLSATVEKDNEERRKGSRDHLYKGLWLIREILNTMIFPQDKKH